jgi:hypothetical protein
MFAKLGATAKKLCSSGEGPDDILDAAKATKEPAVTLLEVARELRDAGTTQHELYVLFDAHQLRHKDDADKSSYNALRDTMDFITGWCSRDHPDRLFAPTYYPHSEAKRARHEAAAAESSCCVPVATEQRRHLPRSPPPPPHTCS